jgi:hypothetical protein
MVAIKYYSPFLRTGAGQVPNCALSFAAPSALGAGERALLTASLRKSGISDAQCKALGARLLLLQVGHSVLRRLESVSISN